MAQGAGRRVGRSATGPRLRAGALVSVLGLGLGPGLVACGGSGGDEPPQASTPSTIAPTVLSNVRSLWEVPVAEWEPADRRIEPLLSQLTARVTTVITPDRVRLRYATSTCPSRPSTVEATPEPTEVRIELSFDEASCPRARDDILVFVVLELVLAFDIGDRQVTVRTVPLEPRRAGTT